MYQKLKDFFLERKISLLVVYGLVAIVATLQEYFGGAKHFDNLPYDFTNYNNYLIFKYSFFHLITGVDLYALHWSEHWDLYKYSPTFALLFGALAWMPDSIGLLLWNFLNSIVLFLAIRMLPSLELKNKNFILLFVLVELFTSLQNAQSNALIAGLIVLAFALMEREKFFLACLCIALTAYIKLFGIVAFALCLLYPQRWKMVGYSIMTMTGLALLPLFVVNLSQLKVIYEGWWHLLQQDYLPNSLTLANVIKIMSGISLAQNLILIIGVGLFVVPFLRLKFYSELYFRLTVLAMILLWIVVFNHKAESPTFIIAMTGIGLWNFSSRLANRWRSLLVLLAFVFTSLSTTDLFPDFIQDNFFEPWSVKVIPCIIVYFVALYELIFKPQQFVHS